MRKLPVLLVVLLIAILNFAMLAKPAAAHSFPRGVCMQIWEQAPPGTKYKKLTACRRYVITHQIAHTCQKPRPLLPRTITVKHVRATKTQRQVLTTALNAARPRAMRFKTYVALVAGITQESTAYNNPGGHGSSVGILQLIDSHGTVAWRLYIPNSVNWFLNGVLPDDRAHPYLSVNDLVQRQQGSGHPTAYAQWVSEATRTVRAFLGPCKR